MEVFLRINANIPFQFEFHSFFKQICKNLASLLYGIGFTHRVEMLEFSLIYQNKTLTDCLLSISHIWNSLHTFTTTSTFFLYSKIENLTDSVFCYMLAFHTLRKFRKLTSFVNIAWRFTHQELSWKFVLFRQINYRFLGFI